MRLEVGWLRQMVRFTSLSRSSAQVGRAAALVDMVMSRCKL
jgi:hypothetical protein